MKDGIFCPEENVTMPYWSECSEEEYDQYMEETYKAYEKYAEEEHIRMIAEYEAYRADGGDRNFAEWQHTGPHDDDLPF